MNFQPRLKKDRCSEFYVYLHCHRRGPGRMNLKIANVELSNLWIIIIKVSDSSMY